MSIIIPKPVAQVECADLPFGCAPKLQAMNQTSGMASTPRTFPARGGDMVVSRQELGVRSQPRQGAIVMSYVLSNMNNG